MAQMVLMTVAQRFDAGFLAIHPRPSPVQGRKNADGRDGALRRPRM